MESSLHRPMLFLCLLSMLLVAVGCKNTSVAHYVSPRISGRVIAAQTQEPIRGVKVERVQSATMAKIYQPQKAGEVMQVAPALTSARMEVGSGARPAEGSSPPLVFALDGSESTYRLGADGSITDLEGLEGELRSRVDGPELPAMAVGSVRLAEPILASTVPAS
ncbi:MAG TPA: hypothetical protein PKA41_16660, partial [Verrucomicrobiota bacterium]|nr:hypothetical protein [Verrucomicrobiota bacterium]